MDGMLNNRMKKWIKEFSYSSLEKDSYHIDELMEIDCPKKNWIEYAWRCYNQAKSECSNFDNIQVILVFYLNTTRSKRPCPKSINRQLFYNMVTPPEIFLIKNLEKDFFKGDVNSYELGEQYSMSCYYIEDFDETDYTYWHYLYFTDVC